MKKIVAVLGATVLSLGLVAACDQSADSGDTRGSSGPVDDRESSTSPDGGRIDVEGWVDDFVSATSAITTVHVVVDQEISASGEEMTSHLEIDIDTTVGAYSAEGDVTGTPFDMSVVDGTAYVSTGGAVQEMSLEQLGMSEADLNPATDIERQRDAITKVELVGNEKVGGVETDHYVITYDVATMNEILDDQSMGGEIQGDTATADIWLDDQMRVTRYKSILKVTAAGTAATVTSDAVYSDFGKPVTIEAPR